MPKPLFFFLNLYLLLFIPAIGLGQTIEWGNPQKLKNKNLYAQIIGENSSGLYMLRCKNAEFASDVIIEKYKSNLSLELSIDVPLTVNGLLERVLIVEGDLYLFMSAKNIGANTIDILSQKLDANLKPVGQPKVLCNFAANLYLEKRKIQIKTNAAKTMVGIMFLSKSADNQGCKLNVFAYKGAEQQVFGKQFPIQAEPKEVFLTAFDLDNQGNSFVLLDYPRETTSKAIDPRAFFMYAYYPESDRMLAYELGNEKLFIEELGMAINNFNKTVSVFGFCSGTSDGDVNSYFFERFSIESKEQTLQFSKEVNPEMLEKLVPGRLEKTPVSLKNFYIRKLIPRSDGGILVVAEKFTRIEQRYNYYLNNMPMEGVRVIFNYDEVAIASFEASGEIQFIDPIRKKQSMVGDQGTAGIAVVSTPDNILVLYNSELDKDGNIMIHQTNYQGKSDEKILIKNTNFSIALIPAEYKQVGALSLVATTIKDKLFTLLRVNL